MSEAGKTFEIKQIKGKEKTVENMTIVLRNPGCGSGYLFRQKSSEMNLLEDIYQHKLMIG